MHPGSTEGYHPGCTFVAYRSGCVEAVLCQCGSCQFCTFLGVQAGSNAAEDALPRSFSGASTLPAYALLDGSLFWMQALHSPAKPLLDRGLELEPDMSYMFHLNVQNTTCRTLHSLMLAFLISFDAL